MTCGLRCIFARAVAFSALVALAACGTTQTITANPNPLPDIVNLLPVSPKAALTKDMTTAAANLDAATAGGFPTADFALCQHLINQQVGIEATVGGPSYPTVTLTDNGAVSLGTEIIVDAMKLAMAKQAGIKVPANCLQALGEGQVMVANQVLGGVALPITVTPPVTGAALAVMVKPVAAVSVTTP